jgi:hypothetical protein
LAILKPVQYFYISGHHFEKFVSINIKRQAFFDSIGTQHLLQCKNRNLKTKNEVLELFVENKAEKKCYLFPLADQPRMDLHGVTKTVSRELSSMRIRVSAEMAKRQPTLHACLLSSSITCHTMAPLCWNDSATDLFWEQLERSFFLLLNESMAAKETVVQWYDFSFMWSRLTEFLTGFNCGGGAVVGNQILEILLSRPCGHGDKLFRPVSGVLRVDDFGDQKVGEILGPSESGILGQGRAENGHVPW